MSYDEAGETHRFLCRTVVEAGPRRSMAGISAGRGMGCGPGLGKLVRCGTS